MFRFELPDIGEGVVEAEILEWKVREGDLVDEDQIIADILTDKAEIEVPCPRAGRVHKLCFQPGDIAPVGAVLIEIDEDAKDDSGGRGTVRAPQPDPGPEAPTPRASPPARRPEPTPPEPSLSEPKAPEVRRPDPAAASRPPELPERPRSSQKASEPPRRSREGGLSAVPAVRDLARRLGVDLMQVRGSGPAGRIMRRDVERFDAGAAPITGVRAETAPAAPEDAEDWERRPLRGLRRAIARKMTRSRRTAAHFTYVDEIDLTDLLVGAEGDPEAPSSPLPFIAHAAVRALADHIVLNSSIDDDRQEIVFKHVVHLGIATATDDGLVVPVIREAARLSVRELAEGIEDLALRAREGGLELSELRGSTFTITSLGKLGGIMSTPILNHPEVAILGVNAIREELRVRDGEPTTRRVMNLSMSVDHRITDGLVCARFIQDVKTILEGADLDAFSGEGESR